MSYLGKMSLKKHLFSQLTLCQYTSRKHLLPKVCFIKVFLELDWKESLDFEGILVFLALTISLSLVTVSAVVCLTV